MEQIYTTPKGSIVLRFDSSSRIIMLQTYGKITVDEHKIGYEKFIDECAARQYPHMIFNNLEMKEDTAEGRAWFGTYIIPKFKKGIGDESKVRIAVVETKNLFQKIATKAIIAIANATGYKFNVKLFDTLEAALAWMKS
jgi:hypothetical protein